MANTMEVSIVALLLAAPSALCRGKSYPYRWVYVARSLTEDSDVGDIKGIVKTASEHGLNGMVLAAGFDILDLQRPTYFRRLEQVKRTCREYNIEIIPLIFSVGRGGAARGHDKNLAAALPVTDASFVVRGANAYLVPDREVEINNGGFEQHNGNRVTGISHDKPGEVSFVDRRVFKGGNASLRLENFGKYRYGHARVMQTVKVRPRRSYKLSCWVKTEALEPVSSLRVLVLAPDGRTLLSWRPKILSTNGWYNIITGFNSLHYSSAKLYVGVWGGKSGKFWVDDFCIKEAGPLNVVRRPGAPLTVKGQENGVIYVEGRDFAPVKDPKLDFRFDHNPPPIRLLPQGRIKEGEHLRVSYYQGISVRPGQIGICMSEPKLYEVWTEQAKLIHKHLAPGKYFLSMDEIRTGGTCQACKERNMTMAQILGDCITKQTQIIRGVNPKAEVLIWSDMLDPNHNARDKYYLVEGDFAGSWKYIPKDLIIVCWYYNKRNTTLRFFSSLGFRTLAGAYYDGNTLENPTGWLESLERTPGASGIMYTTWRNKYDMLGPFGDLVATTGRRE
ncbi:MAG: hypothetical protein JSU94_14630 [Phycisphaerales bacterium]|nr:MAG: hypothetical protein JSU94_14630 [Phycisphaerales bacterium]